jgi:phosphatidylinositol dimannoside acyltransferase
VSRSRRPPGEGRLIQSVYYLYVAGSAVARALPERLAYGIAHACGGLQARLSKKKRPQVERNLSRITGHPIGSPELDAVVLASYRSYARYWLETFALVRETKEFFLERFRCPTAHRIDEVVARGKGAVVVVGHLGNWDAAGAWVGARGQLLVTVAEVLKPRRMFDFFVSHRARLGMKIFAAEKGVTDKLVEEVENGAVIAILGDRDLKGTGIQLDFFGEPATLPAGAASVALRAGVPLLVAGVYGTKLPGGKRGWEAEISEPIELPDERGPGAVEKLTAAAGAKLEEFIARRPEEWHVFQPFWIADKKERPA